jgi:glutamyl-tRNA synthetase
VIAPRGRLAPSPTGHLHLGHALSFLVAYWSIRKKGGSLILRFEDVDVERAASAHIDSARRDLEWLGLTWDEERLQSERLDALRETAVSLEVRGLAYRCICSRGDLRALGAPQAGQVEVRYMGRCRGRFSSASAAGKDAALRFLVPEGAIEVRDELYGVLAFDVAAEVGDFVILRKNGLPSYQLAVVADDDFDGITEVVRGSDLLPSTARQLLLGRALGYRVPNYLHVPLVTDESGLRLAKRNDALGLETFRSEGVSAKALVTWAARATGQLEKDQTLDSPDELGDAFDPRRIPRENIRTDSSLLASLRRES